MTVAMMERPIAIDIHVRAMPAHSKSHENLLYYVAWLDVRAKSACGNPDDRARAAEASQWLKHWLQRLRSPSTTAFILACAEEEIALLADGVESPTRTL